jgi:Mg-chelatase subunit ChlD
LGDPKSRITLGFCTNETPAPPITCVPPVDMMLTIDRSSSMNATETDGRKKLEWAKDAALALVDSISPAIKNNSMRIGVVSFGRQGNTTTNQYSSTLHLPVSNNPETIKTAIRNVKYSVTGTCVECGLRIANQELAKTPSGRDRAAILLSDGRANHTWNGGTSNAGAAATAEANKGRTNKIVYYTVGYGSNVNTSLLTSIAGSSSRYFFRPNVSQWTSTFTTLATNICQ